MSNQTCPKCEHQTIEKGIVRAAGSVVHMFPYDNSRSRSSSIISLYCSSCGYIVEQYVETPEHLI